MSSIATPYYVSRTKVLSQNGHVTYVDNWNMQFYSLFCCVCYFAKTSNSSSYWRADKAEPEGSFTLNLFISSVAAFSIVSIRMVLLDQACKRTLIDSSFQVFLCRSLTNFIQNSPPVLLTLRQTCSSNLYDPWQRLATKREIQVSIGARVVHQMNRSVPRRATAPVFLIDTESLHPGLCQCPLKVLQWSIR